jgi:uncharacterized protein YecE (DUF72 family)
MMSPIIGTAGWSIPGTYRPRFGAGESALARYATRFGGVEINSSFHRPHRPETWARWAASVPAGFRFAVKLPKTISHERKLVACEALVSQFLAEVSGLGEKLAILLLQLPPRLAFDPAVAESFLAELASASAARLVCEPRHPSWFEEAPDALLRRLGIARVAADPAILPAAAHPGGCLELAYWRLHGSPRTYRSSYDDGRLDDYAAALAEARRAGRTAWCIFDNTASSAATGDALALVDRL